MMNEMAALLRVFEATLETLKEDEYKNLLWGKGKLVYEGERKDTPQKAEDNFERELMLLADKLRGANTKEEAVIELVS